MVHQHNSNIAFPQGGDKMVLGAKTLQPTEHTYQAIRQALMVSGSDYSAVYDDFLGAAISTRWATNLATGATIAINAQQSGVIRFTTDTDDDDHATLALGLHFLVSKGWTYFEAGVKSVTAITLRAIEVGLSDALSETGGLAFSNHSVAGVTDVATDAAIFGYDTDSSMTAWAANTVKAGTQQAVNTGVAPSTSAFQKLAVQISPAGKAFFYINGSLVAEVANAVATTAVLTPWISLKSLSGATKSIDVDYVFVAGERS